VEEKKAHKGLCKCAGKLHCCDACCRPVHDACATSSPCVSAAYWSSCHLRRGVGRRKHACC
jgi:hypothetical protein